MTTEEKNKYRQEFNKQNYARIGICIRPEAKQRWEDAMHKMGYKSLTKFISDCIEEKITKEENKGLEEDKDLTGGTGGKMETEKQSIEQEAVEKAVKQGSHSVAILIMDEMPTSCMNCKFLYTDGAAGRLCLASERKIYSPVGTNEGGHYRPNWCRIHSAVAYVDADGRINDIRNRQ